MSTASAPLSDAIVVITTPLGEMTASVYPKHAPVSSAYFLGDIDAGRYADSSIFRIVTEANRSPAATPPIEVLQGGAPIVDLPPSIVHETTAMTGLRHRRGSLSLARFRPGAVYHSFFICCRDEPCLDFGGGRHPDGQGFAAFGEVTHGWEVLDALRAQAEVGEMLLSPIPMSVARRR